MNRFEIILDEPRPCTSKIENISEFIEKEKENLIDFKEFFNNLNFASSLTCNQCSLNSIRYDVRVFIFKNENEVILCINPKIKRLYGDIYEKNEACLTWYGRIIRAERFQSLDMEFYDLDGKLNFRNFSGYSAQVIQHSFSHLNGIEEKIIGSYLHFGV